ncbi:hypothetical protein ACFL12_00725 [Pseudomonadota bacterium]
MYVKSMKDDYTLFDAFNFLGIHLYGPVWTGYEVRREREEDPTPTLDARAPLEEKAEHLASQLSDKYNEQKIVEGRKEIRRVNNEIDNIRREMNENYQQLNNEGDVQSYQVTDYEAWVRFEKAEGKLLKALCNDELRVVCLSGLVVKADLWAEMPKGFGYDLEHSLVFLPSRESSKQMDSGIIRKQQFEDWLANVIPENDEALAEVSPLVHCRSYLKGEVATGVKQMSRDEYMDDARKKIDGLSERQFRQAWTEIVPDTWKARGRRKKK